ncbi:malonyl-CoA decarboxylase domain-containing protein [Piscinibacter sakaiensis]|uniref:malonyl-CoA decarboxylase domain-containing protein n=1 Tax=Piscinibacter sakaiensis TaxID=1547922 RepID=UPI003AAAD6D0
MLDELRQAARRAGNERAVRKLLADCNSLLSERGEANSVAIAASLVERLEALPEEQEKGFFDSLARDFSPDPLAVLTAAQAYAANPNAQSQMALTQVAEPVRQELFRRINRAPGGTAALLRLRRALLGRFRAQKDLRAVEADLFHLLSSWFNPGFLQMRKVDWNSPARLLEKVIHHEAVHEVDGWDDLRRRLEPDRRLFAFFHPQLPDEPLIFVEVALLPEMPAAIAPLINKTSKAQPITDSKVAAFYSISNCEPGLRGVSLGNFLIKRVAEHLNSELPQIKTYCTLSPIPGFAAWLARKPQLDQLPGLKRGAGETLLAARQRLEEIAGPELSALNTATGVDKLDKDGEAALLALCAAYLLYVTPTSDGDPVARFHLDNGARLERLNPRGNMSRNGIKQSHGLMVNYLYDLNRIETSHEKFVQGEVVHSRAVASLI